MIDDSTDEGIDGLVKGSSSNTSPRHPKTGLKLSLQGPRDSDSEEDDPLGGYCGTEKAVELRLKDLREKVKSLFLDYILLHHSKAVEEGYVDMVITSQTFDDEFEGEMMWANAVGNGVVATVEERDDG